MISIHIKKKVIIVILLFPCVNISLGQEHFYDKDSCKTFIYLLKSKEELVKYIDNPCPSDSNCLAEISRAKSEIASGKMTFCMPKSLGSFEIRQEKQLRQLCINKGLVFDYEYFDCDVSRGEVKGCYGLYMDREIAQKLGSDFKETLLRQADSLYVASNPTVYYTFCDILPRLPDKDIHQSTSMNVSIKNELISKLKVSMYGYYPQVDIGFYIDTVGKPSRYFLSQFIIYDGIDENNKFKRELIKIAFEYIKQFKIWRPGVVLNKKVRTEYNVRISFVNESKE